MIWKISLYSIAVAVLCGVCSLDAAEPDPLFSGPQVGETLPSLPVLRVLTTDDERKEVDLAGESPSVLVFVHKFTRPSVYFTRTLMKYAATRKKDGLSAGLVFLGDDRIVLEERLERAKHALPVEVAIGISPDGVDGPGTYGLNRDATLTVLVADKKKVTMNLAVRDPNVPIELPKVLKAICDLVGGEPPKIDDLLTQMKMNQARGNQRMRKTDDRKGSDR